MYQSFHFTSIGASHIKKGTVCQDFSASVETEKYKLAVVSDGHGGADYFRSDRGSRFAAEAFCACVREAFYGAESGEAKNQNAEQDVYGGSEAESGENAYAAENDEASAQNQPFLQNRAKNFADALNACKTEKQTEEQMLWFIRSVIARWNALAEEDAAAEPFRQEELAAVSDKARAYYEKGEKIQSAYGATLIGVVAAEDFWFGVQIGDGKCVVFGRDGEECEPIPWDDKCFLNITTSICDFNAGSEFRYYFGREMPAAVFAGSDGIDDSFKNERHLHNFYRVVLTSFAAKSASFAARELEQYLPNLSARGSADDMSVGCVLDVEYIKANAQLFEKRKEPYLKLFRIGNLGAADASDDYVQKKEIEAEEGVFSFSTLGCGGFGKGSDVFEILAVGENSARLRIDKTEYNVSPSERIVIEKQKQNGDACEYDTLIIQCILK